MLLNVKANAGTQSAIPVVVTDKTRLYIEQEEGGIKVIASDRAGYTTGEVKVPNIEMSASIDDLYSETPYVEVTKTTEEDGTINFGLDFKGITPNKAYIDKVIEALIGGASEDYNTLGKIEVQVKDKASMQALSAEILRATTTENSLQQQIDAIDLTPYATTESVNAIRDDLQNEINTKQDILTAGTGISIDENNVISNTQTSAEWGNIEGTLADQTDLQTALDDKASIDYVDTKIEELGTILVFKGSVATYADLPASGNNPGDVYFVQADESEYVYVEDSGWEKLGPIVDLSAKADIDSPEFTGVPTVPNITDESPDDQIVNKAYADSLISDTSEEALEDLILAGLADPPVDSEGYMYSDNTNTIYI